MAGPIKDVLFRLVGEEDDAVDSLKKVATELEAFSRIHAEAKADVDTTEADRRLEDLDEELDKLALKTVDPKVEMDIATARADIAAFRAELAELDGKTINIEAKVDQDRTIASRLTGITQGVTSLGRAVDAQGGEALSFFERLGRSGVNIGGFSTQLRTFLPLAFSALGVLAALAGGVVALAGSLVEAAAGVGALAVALGGALVPAVGLGIAAVIDFKNNLDDANSTAGKLLATAQRIGRGFDLHRIAGPLESGALDALRRLQDLNPGRALQGPMEAFSRSAGRGLRDFARIVFRPEVIQQFASMIRGAGRALEPFGRIAGDLFRVLLQIGHAAMPFLADAVQGLARGMDHLVQQTSSVKDLRDVVGRLVGQMQSWLGLIKAVGGAFIGFVRAVGPQGRQLVDWLAHGAQALSDWANSQEGRERIRDFLHDVLPLFRDLVTLVAKVVVVLVLLGEAMAPVLDPFVKALNFALGLLIKFLNWLNQTQSGFKAWGRDFAAIWHFIRDKVSGAWHAITGIVGDGLRWIRRKAGEIGSDILGAILWPFRQAGRLIPDVWGKITRGVREGVNAVSGAAKDVWNGMVRTANRIWDKITGVIVGAARWMARRAGKIFGGLAEAWGLFSKIIGGIGQAIATTFRNVGTAIRSVINWIIEKVNKAIDLLGALKDKIPVIGGGGPSIGGILGGIASGAGAVSGGIGGIAGGIAGAVGGQKGLAIVPGTGDGDKHPVMARLESGEMFGVINKRAAAFIKWINKAIPRFPGMAAGGLQPAAAALSRTFLKNFGGYLSSTLRAGDTDSLHSQGLAFDWVGGDWLAASRYANKIGPQLLEGIHQGPPGEDVSWDSGSRVSPSFWGPATWAQHISHIHVAVGEAVKGAVGQMAKLIGKLKFKAPGVYGNIGQGVTDRVRDAANAMIQRLQPKVTGTSGVSLKGVSGNIAQMAGQLVKRTRAPGKAALALFEALWAESGMGSASNNVLQLLSGTAAGSGVSMTNPAAQIAAFLTRGWGYSDPQYGDVHGAIRGSSVVPVASRLAQAIQGSAFPSGSNYQAQYQRALATMRQVGVRGFWRGIKNMAGGLALFGERGPELANVKGGSDVYDAQRTRRILDRMSTGHALDGLKLIVKGDIVSKYDDPVEAVLGSKRFPVAVHREFNAIGAHQRQRQRQRRN